MRGVGLVALSLLLAGCAHATAPVATGAGAPTPGPAKTATPTAGGPAHVEASSYSPTVRPVTAGELRYSWRPGCPVAPSSLRALSVRYRTFSGGSAVGTLIVHRDAVAALSTAFAELYRRGFPIRRMTPIDAYRGSDDASTAADNTSAFNCRAAVAAGPRSWSQHAYGRAVDVNPVENPYLDSGRIIPPAGRGYANRTARRPGMVEAAAVHVFAATGWRWGGRWSSPDFQHFSANGR